MDSVVAAEYELEYLLLEGHCFDVTTGQPPRGLQFTLGTASDPVIVDTIVMANLVCGRHTHPKNIIAYSIQELTVPYCDVSITGLFPAESKPRSLDPPTTKRQVG